MSVVGIKGAPTQARVEPPKPEVAGAGDRFTVTATAVAQIAKLASARKAEGKPTEGLRIGLRGGGCDGFSYVFEWTDKPAEARDNVFEFTHTDGTHVRVFIDPKSILYLQGTTLNFVVGMMGHGFKFENPNVKGSCGCGESVQF